MYCGVCVFNFGCRIELLAIQLDGSRKRKKVAKQGSGGW
ncbi:hypothetical protein SLEP1_g52412 [Rubroshorea leprosula]|uniref:Uncharacterized protein n=1 Tax=Rubroshorea leprosula TaxID=152421 RepID=A0AAV5M9J8_9ROSI|nr:hypothetical protein SLEP1_g52412 [Rubroshorea leprosula]